MELSQQNTTSDRPLYGIELWRHLPMLKEIISYLESPEFAVRGGLSSGVATLHNVLTDDNIVNMLVDLCSKDRSVAIYLIGHMLSLATTPFNEVYTNPFEYAVTAYLHAITTGRKDLTHPVVTAAMMLRNAYWPKRYVKAYLS